MVIPFIISASPRFDAPARRLTSASEQASLTPRNHAIEGPRTANSSNGVRAASSGIVRLATAFVAHVTQGVCHPQNRSCQDPAHRPVQILLRHTARAIE